MPRQRTTRKRVAAVRPAPTDYLALGWRRRVPTGDPAIAERWEATLNGHGCVVYRMHGTTEFNASVRCHRVSTSTFLSACWDACYEAAHSGKY